MKFLIIILICLPVTLISQNLKSYRWEKRLVVIYASSFQDSQAKKQVADIKKYRDILTAYKLVVIEYTNEGQRVNFGEIENIQNTRVIKEFEVVLIGLDGGIKLKSKGAQPAQKFFDLIDSMPMRRNNLRKGE